MNVKKLSRGARRYSHIRSPAAVSICIVLPPEGIYNDPNERMRPYDAEIRPRYLKRYRKIADVLVRHGFGALVTQLGLDQALDLRQRLARPPGSP